MGETRKQEILIDKQKLIDRQTKVQEGQAWAKSPEGAAKLYSAQQIAPKVFEKLQNNSRSLSRMLRQRGRG